METVTVGGVEAPPATVPVPEAMIELEGERGDCVVTRASRVLSFSSSRARLYFCLSVGILNRLAKKSFGFASPSKWEIVSGLDFIFEN